MIGVGTGDGAGLCGDDTFPCNLATCVGFVLNQYKGFRLITDHDIHQTASCDLSDLELSPAS